MIKLSTGWLSINWETFVFKPDILTKRAEVKKSIFWMKSFSWKNTSHKGQLAAYNQIYVALIVNGMWTSMKIPQF